VEPVAQQARPEGKDPRTEKDPRAEYDNLQKRYDAYVQKRNELNDLARQLRQERDLLNEGRRKFRERMDEAAAERDRLNAEMKAAKERRNELQAQAKQLIEQRKGKAGGVAKSLPLQARQLEKQVKDLVHKQETQPHTIEDERELLKLIKAKQTELDQLRKQLDASREIKVDLNDLDSSIDELFRMADAEHEKVKALNKEANRFHEEFLQAAQEARVVNKEANEKHQEFVNAKERADEQHQKAMELKEQMITLRNDRRQEIESQRREVREYNQEARRKVSDPGAMDERADDALEALKKGGKISL
jgi:uncharacterized coiled-coil DUF342 family protein